MKKIPAKRLPTGAAALIGALLVSALPHYWRPLTQIACNQQTLAMRFFPSFPRDLSGTLLGTGVWAGVFMPGVVMTDLARSRVAKLRHTPVRFIRTGEQRHVLLFSNAPGYCGARSSLSVKKLLEQLAADNFWLVYATQNAEVFRSATLEQFDSVVFNNASPTDLTVRQRQILKDWRNAGGGVHYLRNPSHHKKFRQSFAAQVRHSAPLAQGGGTNAKTPAVPRSQPPVPVALTPAAPQGVRDSGRLLNRL